MRMVFCSCWNKQNIEMHTYKTVDTFMLYEAESSKILEQLFECSLMQCKTRSFGTSKSFCSSFICQTNHSKSNFNLPGMVVVSRNTTLINFMRLTFLWQQNETGLMMCASGKKFLLKKNRNPDLCALYEIIQDTV